MSQKPDEEKTGKSQEDAESERAVPEHVLDSIEEAHEGELATEEDLEEALGS